MIRRPHALVAAGLALLTSGCGLPTGDLIVFERNAPELAHASCEEGIYETMPWSAEEAPWLPYPPRDTIQIEHCLAQTPRVVEVYLSFEQVGSEPVAASGDLARIVDVNDVTISVKNETSAMFFARIVAF